MDFDIKSYIGAGPLRYGMSIQEVRNVLGGPFRTFKRAPSVVAPSDQFIDIGVIANYRPAGTVSSIEFAKPSNPTFRGIALFSESVEQLTSLLRDADPAIEIDNGGATSKALGLGFYAIMDEPAENEPGELLSIIAFEKGYHDASKGTT